VRARVVELKQQHEEMLELRRQKLVALLTEEEHQYEQEFFANQETPEQVREKMAKRLQELRTKREEKRNEEVKRRLDVRFEKSADELRKLDSQFQAVNTKLDQEQQMLEKVKRLEGQREGTQVLSRRQRRSSTPSSGKLTWPRRSAVRPKKRKLARPRSRNA
jgi:hypothetical protein